MMSESHEQQDQQLPVVPVVEQPAAALVAPSSATIAPIRSVDHVVPTCNDVISSRYRLTQNNGNAYYDILVQKYKEQLTPILAKLSARNDTESFTRRILTQAAERVVDIVCRDRGGRFIKLAESSVKTGDENYTILSRKNAVKKVYSYFRRSLRITQSSDKTGALKAAPEKAKTDKTKVRSLFQYRIQLNSSTESAEVDPYMIDLITAVCNHAHSVRTRDVKDQIATVARLLETPPVLGIGSTSDSTTASPCTSEAERQGRMRLQLRHRYLAAARVGVSPVDLSKRLLKHWRAGELALAAPPKPPPDVPAQAMPMAVPPSLPQPEMMNTGMTGSNGAVVVADPDKGQGRVGLSTGNNTAVALAAFVADPGKCQNHEGAQTGNNTAVAVAVLDPLKGQDHEGILAGNNSSVVVAAPDSLKDQYHEDGMLPGNDVHPPDVKQNKKAAGCGQWTKAEQADFLRGLELHGPGKWEKITALVPTRTRAQMRARYYRMKKSEEGVPGLPKERKSKKQRTKEPVDPEPREEGIDVERPDMMEPFGQSSAVASAAPSIDLGLPAMDLEPREEGIGVERPDMTEPAGQSAVVASGAATLSVPGLHEVRAYQQPPAKEPMDYSEPIEEGIDAERPYITELVGQSTAVASAIPAIVPGFHTVRASQQPPAKEPMDSEPRDSEPSEEGIGVERLVITQPVEQSTAVASAIPAIVPGFHTVRAFRQSPTKEHENDSEPIEEGISAQSLDI